MSVVGRRLPTLLLALFAAAAPVLAAEDAGPIVERVEIQGNRFVQTDTLLFYVTDHGEQNKNDLTNNQNNELLIFITPRILKS